MDPQEAQGSGTFAGGVQSKRRTGLFTLLFTDVVGSTQLKAVLGDQAGVALIQSHHELVRHLLARFSEAREISTAGDSFLLLFVRPSDALRFALQLQVELRRFNRGRRTPVQDRIGLHMGEVVIEEREGRRDVHGMQVDTCARVMSLAQADQVLMTRPVFDNARQSLKGEEIEGISALEWLNHGRFELKGIDEPAEICEVRTADCQASSGPKTTEKARRIEAPGEEPVLGWRPAVGQVVPRMQWVLEEKLGEGGFGEVWRGRHQKLKEARVFKFCFRADRVRSLKREMTLFRVLKERVGDHPNIVRLLDVNFENPPFYVEQDYVESHDLVSWCAARGGADQVPLETRLELVAQIADALQAAHDAGVIHRDVKPGNILVSGQRPELSSSKGKGNVGVLAKLTDFGIGQVVSEEALKGVTRAGFTQTITADSSSSQTGSQLYMAPELLAGKAASTRSDIYSLGVVLYQLLVGDFKRPVTTDWVQDIGDRLLQDDLRHCFAGKPEDRFSAAAQLARSLRSLPERQAARAAQRAAAAEAERLQRSAAQRRIIALASAGVAAVLLLLTFALGYGLRRAKAAELLAHKHLYAADMLLAAQAFEANNRGRAIHLLERHRSSGGVDLRGWEWRYLWSLCRSEALPLAPGHSDLVSDVAFTREGDLLYSGSKDATIKVWDVDGQSLLSSHCISSPVQTMALSPDGRWLVTDATNNQVVRWDLRTWSGETLMTNKEEIIDLLFSPEGDHLVIRDRWEIHLLQVSNSTCVARLPARGGEKQGESMAFSPDGDFLAFPAGERIGLCELKGGFAIRESPGVMTAINSIAFSPDGRLLAAGDWSPRIAVWDLACDAEVASLTNHTTWVSSVAFLPDGTHLVSAGADQTVRYWATNDWREVATRRGHLDEVSCLASSGRGDRLATGSKDGTLYLWNTTPKPRPATRLELRALALSLDGQTLFASGGDRTMIQYDTSSFEVLRTNSSPYSRDAGVSIGFGSRRLAVGKPDGEIEIRESGTLDLLSRWIASTGKVSGLVFSMDESMLAGVVGENTLSVWNVSLGRHITSIGRLAGGPNCVAVFSPDNKFVATVVEGISVQLWRLQPAELLRTLDGQRQHVFLTFSPDGRFLAVASADASLKLWDVSTGRTTPLPRALMAYFCAAFSPDGQRLAAAGPDPVVRIIDVTTGDEVAALPKGRAFTRGVRFTPDGNNLLALDESGLTVWRATSAGERPKPPRTNDE